MARQLQLASSGAIYHVTSRVNAQNPIFLDEEDRELFQTCLGEAHTAKVVRNKVIRKALADYGYSMAKITHQVGLLCSTLIKIIKGGR